jgi:hypothetical protein
MKTTCVHDVICCPPMPVESQKSPKNQQFQPKPCKKTDDDVTEEKRKIICTKKNIPPTDRYASKQAKHHHEIIKK